MLMAVGEYEAAQDSESIDEFAVPQGSEKELQSQQGHIEKLFGVSMIILGVLTQDQLPLQSAGHQPMWVQLRGERRSIVKAKDYIKGLCTPELIDSFSYQRELHCIFFGARGLFLDCLVRATSACIKPQTHGLLRISGLAEAVVMAQSRIHAFLDGCQAKSEEQEASIKRNFKALVEEYNDQYALDLLILPTFIKEQLLALVEEDKDGERKQPTNHQRVSRYPTDKGRNKMSLFLVPVEYQKQLYDKVPVSQPVDITEPKPGKRILRERASEPRELNKDEWEKEPMPLSRQEMTLVDVSKHEYDSYPSEEFAQRELLRKDYEFQQISGLLGTIIGSEDGEPGSYPHFSLGSQKEFNMLLDFFRTMGYQESIVRKVLSENGIQEPSQILDKVKLEQSSHDHGKGSTAKRPSALEEMSHVLSSDNSSGEEDDYLLGVMKSAAKNCGYSPSEIEDIGDGSVTGLLRKLNQKISSEDNSVSNVPQNKRPQGTDSQFHIGFNHPRPEINLVNPVLEKSNVLRRRPAGNNHPVEDIFHGGLEAEAVGTEEPRDHIFKEKPNAPVVTGAQRFKEAMQTPFQLNLKNEKGNDQLRHIIIDGSNVAKIHGLHRFYSCRGIALAVQYFWDRGHRNITVFVPQWRTKKDKAKEQHFLTELNDLGLLSFTPSRTVEGKKITSYDDRFMLQLAERTDGVIVTNDYLRDMFAESQAWQNIIKDRLLQFTFVGDIFMVPDDPLGKNGPPLSQFLTKNSLPRSKAKGHSFAGRRSPHVAHSPPKPSSQTEVLNLRDRKAGGHKNRDEVDLCSPRDTERLRRELLIIFPEQDTKVDFILNREPCVDDLNKLSEMMISLKF
ncbi:protein KHNYN-like [Gastrophryne carolinensis]